MMNISKYMTARRFSRCLFVVRADTHVWVEELRVAMAKSL
jgi:hypothetical protein